ncbi:MAG: dipicolinate synthase subunit B [Defluviitaleaceae bacterium]|nr:dipicolinate synthase subunit B [Defluviitaleaceae bacterium]
MSLYENQQNSQNSQSNIAQKRIGVAITGSFCNFDSTLFCVEEIVKKGAQVTAILSYAVDTTDTRFMKAEELKKELENITKNPIVNTIVDAEPIGPQNLFDIILVLPATGNTLAKIAVGITDTPVTMAVKSQLRNDKPVLLAMSTNDALGNNAKNIGQLLNTKKIFFVPFGQDDPIKKPKSMVFLPDQVIPAIEEALEDKQLQPMLGISLY